MPFRFLLLFVALTLCGCIGGERIALDTQSPPAPRDTPLKPVALAVSDDREEVKRGDWKEWYLGEAPGQEDQELSNRQLVPLHSQMRSDLVDELKSLGFDVVAEPDVRRLELSIRDWYFDAGAHELRYRVDIKVLARDDGQMIAQSMLQERKPIGGPSAKAAKNELKVAYAQAIHSLVRDNSTVRSALER